MRENISEFSPTEHGFIPLRDFDRGEGLEFYEYGNHESVDGNVDFCRLNYYMSKDSDYVTVWQGCLEYVLMEAKLGELPLGYPDYQEQIFRGYIDSTEQAGHIIQALRLTESPSKMVKTEAGKVECHPI